MVRLASIHVYPVKGVRGVDLTESLVEPWGIAGDRRWMLVNGDGKFLNQREAPGLTAAVASVGPAGDLRVRARPDGPAAAAGLPPLVVPPDSAGTHVPVEVWGSRLAAALAPDEAHSWFGTLLGRDDVRLVYLDDPTRRPVDPMYSEATDRVSFADAYPVLLASTASLDALNDWLLSAGRIDEALPMNRFRPTLVVDGAAAWAEDDWERLRIGTVEFRCARACGRCLVTTIDQDTGVRGGEPLKILGERRNQDGSLAFGENLIPDGTGTVRVGDEVEILR